MIECWSNVSNNCKGILLILVGAILLLHSMGILTQGLTIVIVLISIAMVLQGLVMCGGTKFLQKLFKREGES